MGWVAFQPGHGHLGTILFEAGNTEQTVTEQPVTIQFTHPFDTVPRFFASIATHVGADSSQLRQDSSNVPGSQLTEATFYIEEESCVDDESSCNEYLQSPHSIPVIVLRAASGSPVQ